MLEAVLGQLRRHRHHPAVDFAHVEQLVVAGGDDGDELGHDGDSEDCRFDVRHLALGAQLSSLTGQSRMTQVKASITDSPKAFGSIAEGFGLCGKYRPGAGLWSQRFVLTE